jgi:hypothetical protein
VEHAAGPRPRPLHPGEGELMISRADDLCDLAAAVIAAAAVANPIVGTTVTVTCEDDPDTDTSEMLPGQMKVYVSWEFYEDGGPASRGDDITDYQLVILCVEVSGDPGKVSREWRKVRSAWVDKCVVEALGNARKEARLDGAFALRLDRVAHSFEELAERKAYWMGVAITLRDIRSKAA